MLWAKADSTSCYGRQPMHFRKAAGTQAVSKVKAAAIV